jgi:hypothetical protein
MEAPHPTTPEASDARARDEDPDLETPLVRSAPAALATDEVEPPGAEARAAASNGGEASRDGEKTVLVLPALRDPRPALPFAIDAPPTAPLPTPVARSPWERPPPAWERSPPEAEPELRVPTQSAAPPAPERRRAAVHPILAAVLVAALVGAASGGLVAWAVVRQHLHLAEGGPR